MELTKEFENEIAPFVWVEHRSGASVCLNINGYLQEVFDTRADEGFLGNGYDWGSLAQVFLDEKCSRLREKIHFDPEAGMFCAYSEEKEALADFILRFKKACDDKAFISDLFSRAELD
ncbi:immunity 51 family protein [Lachnospiraceae bacterium 29-84]